MYSAPNFHRLPGELRRGRGTLSNRSGRYEQTQRHPSPDEWQRRLDSGEAAPILSTEYFRESAKSAISRNTSPDILFDQSINAYRGCEHGCVYCYARPTHAWQGLSPGLDFESKIFFKPDIPARLAEELSAPGYVAKPIAMGTNTDPYQPYEKSQRLTRQILEILEACNHPVSIVTKSYLVVRDLDILSAMAQRNLVKVAVSICTLDATLARRMEPRAASPTRRLEAIEALATAGVPTAVMTAPIIPGLADVDMEKILERAHHAGAEAAGYTLLRLPLEIKELFFEWLADCYPARTGKVERLIREMRAGKLNVSTFGKRMHGQGTYAAMIGRRFRLTCRRLGLNERDLSLDLSQFKPPVGFGGQLSLF